MRVVISDCCTPLFQFLFVISFEHSAAFEDQRLPLINRFLNNRGSVVIFLLITVFLFKYLSFTFCREDPCLVDVLLFRYLLHSSIHHYINHYLVCSLIAFDL
jgi:hypothetical protein